VHFMRSVPSAVPKTASPMVASTIRATFAQLGTGHVFIGFHEVVRMVNCNTRRSRQSLRIRSTKLLERLNKESERSTDVVGPFHQHGEGEAVIATLRATFR
jgi:transposase-like protein